MGELLQPLQLEPAWQGVDLSAEASPANYIEKSVGGMVKLLSAETTHEIGASGLQTMAPFSEPRLLTVVLTSLSCLGKAVEVVKALKKKPASWHYVCLLYLEEGDLSSEPAKLITDSCEHFTHTVLLSEVDGHGTIWDKKSVLRGSAHWVKLIVAANDLGMKSWEPLKESGAVPQIGSIKLLHRTCPMGKLKTAAAEVLQSVLLDYLLGLPSSATTTNPRALLEALATYVNEEDLHDKLVSGSNGQDLFWKVQDTKNETAPFQDYSERVAILLETWQDTYIPEVGDIILARGSPLKEKARAGIKQAVDSRLNSKEPCCLPHVEQELKRFCECCSQRAEELKSKSLRLAQEATVGKRRLEESRQALARATRALPRLLALILFVLLSLGTIAAFERLLFISPQHTWGYYVAIGAVPVAIIVLHVWAVMRWWDALHNLWTFCLEILATNVASPAIDSLVNLEMSSYYEALADEGGSQLRHVRALLAKLEGMKEGIQASIKPSPELIFRYSNEVEASILDETKLKTIDKILNENPDQAAKDVLGKLPPIGDWLQMSDQELQTNVKKGCQGIAGGKLAAIPLAELYTGDDFANDLKLADPWLQPKAWSTVPIAQRHVFAAPLSLPLPSVPEDGQRSRVKLCALNGEENEAYIIFLGTGISLLEDRARN